MNKWAYHIERLGGALTEGDTKMDESIHHLRKLAPRSGFAELEDELEALLKPKTAQRRLNELGRDGWELVAVTIDAATGNPVAFLKRPID